MKFEWNAQKAAATLRKHAVSFQEALTVFADQLARVHSDPEHSIGEIREIIVGYSSEGRLLLVHFIESAESVRLISARHATTHERHDYEEGSR